MKLVFQEMTRNALSFSLLLEFHRTANGMCERLFGVTAPDSLSGIRLHSKSTDRYVQELLLVVKLTGSSETDLNKAEQKWKAIGEDFNWHLLGVLKDDADISEAIDGEFLSEDWARKYQ